MCGGALHSEFRGSDTLGKEDVSQFCGRVALLIVECFSEGLRSSHLNLEVHMGSPVFPCLHASAKSHKVQWLPIVVDLITVMHRTQER